MAVAASDEDEAVLEIHILPPEVEHLGLAACAGLAERQPVQMEHIVPALALGQERPVLLVADDDRLARILLRRLALPQDRVTVGELAVDRELEHQVQDAPLLLQATARQLAIELLSRWTVPPAPAQVCGDVGPPDVLQRGVVEALGEEPPDRSQ